ncbi:MAG: hypothetical protein ACKVU4_08220 [Phycisphaerales bacterium]
MIRHPWIPGPLAVVLVCALGGEGRGVPRASPPQLEPGQVLRLTFPDLPPTLLAMSQGKEVEAAVTVRLPDNYTRDGSFPLFVFLNGGDGGEGGNIGVPMQLSEGRDCIIATFPLFKRGYDAAEPWGISVGFDDYPIVSAAYAAVMDRLRATIPNIDAGRSIIGGHSNGAHTIAVLLSALDDGFLGSFKGFFMIDGGFDWSSYGRSIPLKDHRMLYLVGGGTEHSPWWRRDVVQRARFFERCVQDLGMDYVKVFVADGVDHQFSRSYHPVIKEWAAGVMAP